MSSSSGPIAGPDFRDAIIPSERQPDPVVDLTHRLAKLELQFSRLQAGSSSSAGGGSSGRAAVPDRVAILADITALRSDLLRSTSKTVEQQFLLRRVMALEVALGGGGSSSTGGSAAAHNGHPTARTSGASGSYRTALGQDAMSHRTSLSAAAGSSIDTYLSGIRELADMPSDGGRGVPPAGPPYDMAEYEMGYSVGRATAHVPLAARLRHLDVHVHDHAQQLDGIKVTLAKAEVERRLASASTNERHERQSAEVGSIRQRVGKLERAQGTGTAAINMFQVVSTGLEAIQKRISKLEGSSIKGLEKKVTALQLALPLASGPPSRGGSRGPSRRQSATGDALLQQQASEGSVGDHSGPERLAYLELNLSMLRELVQGLYDHGEAVARSSGGGSSLTTTHEAGGLQGDFAPAVGLFGELDSRVGSLQLRMDGEREAMEQVVLPTLQRLQARLAQLEVEQAEARASRQASLKADIGSAIISNPLFRDRSQEGRDTDTIAAVPARRARGSESDSLEGAAAVMEGRLAVLTEQVGTLQRAANDMTRTRLHHDELLQQQMMEKLMQQQAAFEEQMSRKLEAALATMQPAVASQAPATADGGAGITVRDMDVVLHTVVETQEKLAWRLQQLEQQQQQLQQQQELQQAVGAAGCGRDVEEAAAADVAELSQHLQQLDRTVQVIQQQLESVPRGTGQGGQLAQHELGELRAQLGGLQDEVTSMTASVQPQLSEATQQLRTLTEEVADTRQQLAQLATASQDAPATPPYGGRSDAGATTAAAVSSSVDDVARYADQLASLAERCQNSEDHILVLEGQQQTMQRELEHATAVAEAAAAAVSAAAAAGANTAASAPPDGQSNGLSDASSPDLLARLDAMQQELWLATARAESAAAAATAAAAAAASVATTDGRPAAPGTAVPATAAAEAAGYQDSGSDSDGAPDLEAQLEYVQKELQALSEATEEQAGAMQGELQELKGGLLMLRADLESVSQQAAAVGGVAIHVQQQAAEIASLRQRLLQPSQPTDSHPVATVARAGQPPAAVAGAYPSQLRSPSPRLQPPAWNLPAPRLGELPDAMADEQTVDGFSELAAADTRSSRSTAEQCMFNLGSGGCSERATTDELNASGHSLQGEVAGMWSLLAALQQRVTEGGSRRSSSGRAEAAGAGATAGSPMADGGPTREGLPASRLGSASALTRPAWVTGQPQLETWGSVDSRQVRRAADASNALAAEAQQALRSDLIALRAEVQAVQAELDSVKEATAVASAAAATSAATAPAISRRATSNSAAAPDVSSLEAALEQLMAEVDANRAEARATADMLKQEVQAAAEQASWAAASNQSTALEVTQLKRDSAAIATRMEQLQLVDGGAAAGGVDARSLVASEVAQLRQQLLDVIESSTAAAVAAEAQRDLVAVAERVESLSQTVAGLQLNTGAAAGEVQAELELVNTLLVQLKSEVADASQVTLASAATAKQGNEEVHAELAVLANKLAVTDGGAQQTVQEQLQLLQQEVAATAVAVDATATVAQQADDALQASLAALTEQLGLVGQHLADVTGNDLQQLRADVDALKGATAGEAQVQQAVQQLRADVDALMATTAGSDATAEVQQAVDMLRADLSAMNVSNVGDGATADAAAETRQAVEDLRTELAALAERLAALEHAAQTMVQAESHVSPRQLQELQAQEQAGASALSRLQLDVEQLAESITLAQDDVIMCKRAAAGVSDLRAQFDALRESVTAAVDESREHGAQLATQVADAGRAAAAAEQRTAALTDGVRELQTGLEGVTRLRESLAAATERVSRLEEELISQVTRQQEAGQQLADQLVEQVKQTREDAAASLEQAVAGVYLRITGVEERLAAELTVAAGGFASAEETAARILAVEEQLSAYVRNDQMSAVMTTVKNLHSSVQAMEEQAASHVESLEAARQQLLDDMQSATAELRHQLQLCATAADVTETRQHVTDSVQRVSTQLEELRAQLTLQLEEEATTASAQNAAELDKLRMQLTSAVAELHALIQTDCIRADQLANIFAARDKMYESWTKMQTVFESRKYVDYFAKSPMDRATSYDTLVGSSSAGGGAGGSDPAAAAAAAAAVGQTIAEEAAAPHGVPPATAESESAAAAAESAAEGHESAAVRALRVSELARFKQAHDAAVAAAEQQQLLLSRVEGVSETVSRLQLELSSRVDAITDTVTRSQAELGSRVDAVSDKVASGQAEWDAKIFALEASLGEAVKHESVGQIQEQLAELQQQVSLLMYRSDSAARQEQVNGMAHAIVSLELQLKRHQQQAGAPPPAAVAAATAPPARHGSGSAGGSSPNPADNEDPFASLAAGGSFPSDANGGISTSDVTVAAADSARLQQQLDSLGLQHAQLEQRVLELERDAAASVSSEAADGAAAAAASQAAAPAADVLQLQHQIKALSGQHGKVQQEVEEVQQALTHMIQQLPSNEATVGSGAIEAALARCAADVDAKLTQLRNDVISTHIAPVQESLAAAVKIIEQLKQGAAAAAAAGGMHTAEPITAAMTGSSSIEEATADELRTQLNQQGAALAAVQDRHRELTSALQEMSGRVSIAMSRTPDGQFIEWSNSVSSLKAAVDKVGVVASDCTAGLQHATARITALEGRLVELAEPVPTGQPAEAATAHADATAAAAATAASLGELDDKLTQLAAAVAKVEETAAVAAETAADAAAVSSTNSTRFVTVLRTVGELVGRVNTLQEASATAAATAQDATAARCETAELALRLQRAESMLQQHQAEHAQHGSSHTGGTATPAADLTVVTRKLGSLRGDVAALEETLSEQGRRMKAVEEKLCGDAERVQELGREVEELSGLPQRLAQHAARFQECLANIEEEQTSRAAAMRGQLEQLQRDLLQLQRTAPATVGGAAGVDAGNDGANSTLLASVQPWDEEAVAAVQVRFGVLHGIMDSTQSMVRDLHAAHGELLARVESVEAAAGSSTVGRGSGGGADMIDFAKQLQENLRELEAQFHDFEANHTDVTQALTQLQSINARLDGCEAKSSESTARMAGVVQTLPVFASQLKGLESKLHSQLDVSRSALDTLTTQLSELKLVAKQKANISNPFAGLNPNSAAQEVSAKLEAVRAALYASTTELLEALQVEQAQRRRGSDSGSGTGSSSRSSALDLMRSVQALSQEPTMAPADGGAETEKQIEELRKRIEHMQSGLQQRCSESVRELSERLGQQDTAVAELRRQVGLLINNMC